MSLSKKAIGGSIHRIREFELEKVNLTEEFDILQIVGEGWFGKILLTDHRTTQTEMVLKALPKAYTSISSFFREFHYGLHLSAHRNIVTTYDVAFETAGFYVFSQEYAPLGDLASNITETGLGELHSKRVARQLAAAVNHIHSRDLVHRDIKLDNVLVFRSDFSRIKLCDFGETRRVNSVVQRHNEWLPYSPPEIMKIDTDKTYRALVIHDIWQFGIVLFICLTGCVPWQKAAPDDPRYLRYYTWHTATLNIARKPKLFHLISSRAQRMFKRLLDPKPEKRCTSVFEINRFVEDRWLAKPGTDKTVNGGADDRDELCPSMYSFHSSLEEKNQLLYTLTTYGIETIVDRTKKKDRIREWIQSSAIAEEEEEEDSEFDFDVFDSVETENMKNRHFPEVKPNVEVKEQKKPVNGVKPTERKTPFVPKVAEERQKIAKLAIFPNGDPSLGIQTNGLNLNNEVNGQNNNVKIVNNRDIPIKNDELNNRSVSSSQQNDSTSSEMSNSLESPLHESNSPTPPTRKNKTGNGFSAPVSCLDGSRVESLPPQRGQPVNNRVENEITKLATSPQGSSATSQLVLQSFSAINSVNNVISSEPKSPTPRHRQALEKHSPSKDIYEQYVTRRTEPKRRGSNSGSGGSRSVSN